MTYIDFFLPFLTYGLPSLLIGTLIGTVYFFITEFAPEKFSRFYGICFVIGIAFYTVYEVIKSGNNFRFGKETISMGLVCGSLGLGVFAFIKNLKSGKLDKEPIFTIIKEIISVSVKDSVAKDIAQKIMKNISALNGENLYQDILDVLKLFPQEITESDAETLARLLYHGILPYLKAKNNPDA